MAIRRRRSLSMITKGLLHDSVLPDEMSGGIINRIRCKTRGANDRSMSDIALIAIH